MFHVATIAASTSTTLKSEILGETSLLNVNVVIDELIREYFIYNKYQNACSALITEAGLRCEA